MRKTIAALLTVAGLGLTGISGSFATPLSTSALSSRPATESLIVGVQGRTGAYRRCTSRCRAMRPPLRYRCLASCRRYL